MPVRSAARSLYSRGVSVGGGSSDALAFPVFDAGNADHRLHMIEDFSAYATPAAIPSTQRADGGKSWTCGNVSNLSFIADPCPWGAGSKCLDIHAVNPGMFFGGANSANGIVAAQQSSDSPPFLLNVDTSRHVVVYEFSWKQGDGDHVYQGKVVDYAHNTFWRHDFDPRSDRIGLQGQTWATNPLEQTYYLSNLNPNPSAPGYPDMPPGPGEWNPTSATNSSNAAGPITMFYKQNMGHGSVGSMLNWGQYQAGPINGFGPFGNGGLIMRTDKTWRRFIVRITKPGNGLEGYGRMEVWVQRAGSEPVKIWEYVGDPGARDAGRVYTFPSTSNPFANGMTFSFFNLTAGIHPGTSHTRVGYLKLWSHPRQEL